MAGVSVMWQVVAEGRPIGRYDEHLLLEWTYRGRVSPTDLLWRPGMSAAMPARFVLPFAAVFDSRPTRRPGRWTAPIGRSSWAIAAGYLGPLCLLVGPGPIAVVVSLRAIRDVRRHQLRHGFGRAVFGLVAGLLATLALIAGLIDLLMR